MGGQESMGMTSGPVEHSIEATLFSIDDTAMNFLAIGARIHAIEDLNLIRIRRDDK